MSSLRHVLLKNRLHLSLMDFWETFSNWRTDFRRSTGREWSKEPISTDITTNNNTNFLFIIFLPTFQCTITHFQGNLSSFVSKIKIYSQLFEYQLFCVVSGMILLPGWPKTQRKTLILKRFRTPCFFLGDNERSQVNVNLTDVTLQCYLLLPCNGYSRQFDVVPFRFCVHRIVIG